ncbi:DUF2946 domain-containing protein [Candidimonas sp. SYP-B2681]|uniref:DUF2946 domain-containing protein n=1 Tax=Candidimonas sp. SYP-B2681 TaxID=2497686 RepID=UPI000F89B214|nr:DUF2946 domain-containing protein [Candidimonas sp. SYP-B2681]RTZ39165.1 DUF2946 domain-containing protein [Candidimonas sp. SYP-B2681]
MAGNRSRHLSAWLALFAMLLILIAPVISQSLAVNRAPMSDISRIDDHNQSHRPEHTSGRYPLHARAAGALDSPDQRPIPAEHSDHRLAECGYCTLTGKLPALAGFSCCVLDGAVFTTHPLRAGTRNGRPIKAIFPNALSRAPPFFAHNAVYPRGT